MLRKSKKQGGRDGKAPDVFVHRVLSCFFASPERRKNAYKWLDRGRKLRFFDESACAPCPLGPFLGLAGEPLEAVFVACAPEHSFYGVCWGQLKHR